ncbi:MAG: exosome complex protein Rrp4 [Candidatus Micrarchaeota archaeon]
MKIVVPGELLAEKPVRMADSYIEGGKTYSEVVGLFHENEMKLVALEGAYLPMDDDYVVGVVEEVKFAGCTVEINSPYSAFLSNKDTRFQFEMGDILFAKVKGVDEVKNVNLFDARKLVGGEILQISAVKIPRVIGKKSSMLNMLIDATRSEIYVGKNGRLWVKGGDTSLAARAILKIAREAHVQGLTDRMKEFLEAEKQANNKT